MFSCVVVHLHGQLVGGGVKGASRNHVWQEVKKACALHLTTPLSLPVCFEIFVLPAKVNLGEP